MAKSYTFKSEIQVAIAESGEVIFEAWCWLHDDDDGDDAYHGKAYDLYLDTMDAALRFVEGWKWDAVRNADLHGHKVKVLDTEHVIRDYRESARWRAIK